MQRTRNDLLFNIRYATFLMERQRALCANTDKALRVCSLLSGLTGLATITHAYGLALVAGGFFAALMAAEAVLRPGDEATKAAAQRKVYAKLMVEERTASDEALDEAYRLATADDEIRPRAILKELAYNDALLSLDRDPAYAYPTNWRHNLFNLIS